jgi:hypothetical protein
MVMGAGVVEDEILALIPEDGDRGPGRKLDTQSAFFRHV